MRATRNPKFQPKTMLSSQGYLIAPGDIHDLLNKKAINTKWKRPTTVSRHSKGSVGGFPCQDVSTLKGKLAYILAVISKSGKATPKAKARNKAAGTAPALGLDRRIKLCHTTHAHVHVHAYS